MAERQTGTVRWYSAEKGQGFIANAAGEEFYVHFRDIRGAGFRTLDPGQRVEFTPAQGERGPQALDVQVRD